MNDQLLTLIFLICMSSIYSQIKATTLDGKRVTLYENKTWEYEKSEHSLSQSSIALSDCNAIISTETDKVTGKSTTA